MKKGILLTIMVITAALSGCDAPDPAMSLGSLHEGVRFSTSGFFDHALIVPVPQEGNKPTIYVQGGVSKSKDLLRKDQPFCSMSIAGIQFGRPGLVSSLRVKAIPLTSSESAKGSALLSGDELLIPTISMIRNGNVIQLHIENYFWLPVSEARRIGGESADINSTIKCYKPCGSSWLGTTEMNLGELFEVFDFHYEAIPPSL